MQDAGYKFRVAANGSGDLKKGKGKGKKRRMRGKKR